MRDKEIIFEKHKDVALELIKKFNKTSKKYRFILIKDEDIGFGNIRMQSKPRGELYDDFHLSEFWDCSRAKVLEYMYILCIKDLESHSEKVVRDEYREIYNDMVRVFREDNISCILD